MNACYIIDEIFEGDLTGIVCIGNAVAVNKLTKFETLCEYLDENNFVYDVDVEEYGRIYLIVIWY